MDRTEVVVIENGVKVASVTIEPVEGAVFVHDFWSNSETAGAKVILQLRRILKEHGIEKVLTNLLPEPTRRSDRFWRKNGKKIAEIWEIDVSLGH